MDENYRPLTAAEFQKLIGNVNAEVELDNSVTDNLLPSGPTNNVSQSAEQFPPMSSMNQTQETPSHLELEDPSTPDGGLVSQVNSEIANVLIPASESGNQALCISGFRGNTLEKSSLSAENHSFQSTAIEEQTLQASRSARPKQTGEKPFVCNICNKTFTTSSGMKVHRRSHTGENTFVCDICEKRFTTSSGLKAHRRTHTGEKPFVCDICQKRFTTSAGMKAHRRTHTGEKPFVCDICKKTFTTSSGMKAHKRSHTEKKPFVCDICQKSFQTSSEKKVHRRRHTGEKPFVCHICKKSFTDLSTHKSHLRIHTGEKPFVCHICQKGFTDWSNLRSHVTIHTDERRFVCFFCKRSFRQSIHLQRHLRTHTKERPYICGTCRQCFKHPSTLSSHQKKAHTAKTFFCYSCRRCFHTIVELENHQKHHNTKCPLTCGNCKKIYFSDSGLQDHKKKCIKVGAVEAGSFETVVRDDSETKTLYGENDTVTASRDSGDTQVAGFSGNLVNMSDINTTPVVNAIPFPTTSTSTLYVIPTFEGVTSVILDGQLSSTQDANSSGEQSNFNVRDQIDFEAEGNETRPKRQ